MNLQQQSFNMEQQNYAIQSLQDTQHTVSCFIFVAVTVWHAVLERFTLELVWAEYVTILCVGASHEGGLQGHEGSVQEAQP